MKYILAFVLIIVIIEVTLANVTKRPLPSCATVKCAEACLNNPTRCTTKCNATRPCPGNMACINGLCDCPQDTYYKNGRCRPIIPFDPSCAAVQCLKGSSCKNGKCSIPNNKCLTVKCSAGYHCVNGRCVPNLIDPSCAAVQCLEGSICKNGRCSIPTTTPYDQCIHIKCSAGFYCYKSHCIPNPPTTTTIIDSCTGVRCGPDQICFIGTCMPIFTHPTFNT